MEQVVVLFLGFLFCGLDVGMLCVFFQSMFERKHSSVFFGCACVITTGIIFGVNSFQNSMLNFVILPLVMWIFTVTMWKLSLRKAFIYMVIFYIVFVDQIQILLCMFRKNFFCVTFEYFFSILNM